MVKNSYGLWRITVFSFPLPLCELVSKGDHSSYRSLFPLAVMLTIKASGYKSSSPLLETGVDCSNHSMKGGMRNMHTWNQVPIGNPSLCSNVFCLWGWNKKGAFLPALSPESVLPVQWLPYLSSDAAQNGLLKILWDDVLSLLENNLKPTNNDHLSLTNDSCGLTRFWVPWGEGLSLQVSAKIN